METHRANLRLVEPEATSFEAPRLHSVRFLSLDAHGRVLDWMSWQDAACLYARGAVAWTLGDPCLTVHGGICRAKWVDRAPMTIRLTGRPQRGHGSPVRW